MLRKLKKTLKKYETKGLAAYFVFHIVSKHWLFSGNMH